MSQTAIAGSPNILVYSKTNGYRHASIPTAIKTIQKMAGKNNWDVTATEDSTFFTPNNLEAFDLIVFVSPTGDILNRDQEKAVEQFVEGGKSLLTIHAGTDAEFDWPWYMNAIGAKFLGHPPTQKAQVIIEDRNNPSTKCFPDSVWEAEDEWYSFTTNPRDKVHVLISIDENSYDVDDNRWFAGAKQRMGDHPLVWYKMVGKGLVYQSAFGHTDAMYSNPVYICHLKGAIKWLTKE